MRPGTIAAAIVLAGTATAHAALPPQYQRSRELVAVIEAAADAFNGREIHQVTFEGGGAYRVEAGSCSLTATIVPQPMPDGMVGAMQFTVSLGTVTCNE